jgi:hypothetical protein
MGTCTAVIRKRHVGVGAGVELIVDVNLSGSYATGGDTLTRASLGADSIQAIIPCSGGTTPGGHPLEYITPATETSNWLVRGRDAATGAELGNGSNQSAQSQRVIVKANYPYV